MSTVYDSSPVYLKPGVKIEVTVNRWFVWPHLIAPVQQAMNLAFRYVPIMQSFIANPQMHINASSNPKLTGGPYINLPITAVAEVKKILGQTLQGCAGLIEFASDLRTFNKELQETATGYSLDEYHSRIPASLAGKIELQYDINNHPSMRVIEEVVCRSELAREASVEICLSTIHDTERKFFMNTPRIDRDEAFYAEVDLLDPLIDVIAGMRTRPESLDALSVRFGPDIVRHSMFRDLFTPEAPVRKSPDYHGAGVRVRHFGHACILLQTAQTSILIDPVVTCDPDNGDGRFILVDLPDTIDYVVISHGHQDHFSAEILLQLRQRVRTFIVPRNKSGNVADPSLKLMLQRLGCRDVRAVDTFDSIEFPDGRIVSMPFSGEHGDLDIHSKQTIFVELKGRRFFFLVDSDAIAPALYDTVSDMVGKVDGLFIGMECFGAPMSWLYGPLLATPLSRKDSNSRRLSASNSQRAWRLVTSLGCSKAFIYAMGQEPWLRYVMGNEFEPGSVQLQQVASFLEECRNGGVDVEYIQISREMFY